MAWRTAGAFVCSRARDVVRVAMAAVDRDTRGVTDRARRAGQAAHREQHALDVRKVDDRARYRLALVDAQRDFAAREPGAILDGRDIGTVILTHADAKIFVTASLEARARRRWREAANRGERIPYDEVLADIRRRDARDQGRDTAPLRAAPDAVLLDTTDLSIDAAFDAARRIVEAARARSGST